MQLGHQFARQLDGRFSQPGLGMPVARPIVQGTSERSGLCGAQHFPNSNQWIGRASGSPSRHHRLRPRAASAAVICTAIGASAHTEADCHVTLLDRERLSNAMGTVDSIEMPREYGMVTGVERERVFQRVLDELGPSLFRLTLGYEFDPEQRRDLLQDIHLAVWRSLDVFDGRCWLRTWVYRVAHNTAATHVLRRSVGRFSTCKPRSDRRAARSSPPRARNPEGTRAATVVDADPAAEAARHTRSSERDRAA